MRKKTHLPRKGNCSSTLSSPSSPLRALEGMRFGVERPKNYYQGYRSSHANKWEFQHPEPPLNGFSRPLGTFGQATTPTCTQALFPRLCFWTETRAKVKWSIGQKEILLFLYLLHSRAFLLEIRAIFPQAEHWTRHRVLRVKNDHQWSRHILRHPLFEPNTLTRSQSPTLVVSRSAHSWLGSQYSRIRSSGTKAGVT